jgi:putative hydrolase of the HAD superfamily
VQLKISKNTVIVFDLDDTMYKEIDYLRSAFQEISDKIPGNIGTQVYPEMLKMHVAGEDVFGYIIKKYRPKEITKDYLLKLYRNHKPALELDMGMASFINELYPICRALGMITNGRSSTQRNKIRALNLERFMSSIVISEEIGTEKPSKEIYLFLERKYVGGSFVYIGDNMEIDFIAPNQLGWNSICILDDGNNIHKQNMNMPERLMPRHFIHNIGEIEIIVTE